MVNKAVFLKKKRTLRAATYIGHFRDDKETHQVLDEGVSKKIVKLANDRLRTSLQENAELRSCDAKIEWLRHSQITLGACLGTGSFSRVYSVKTVRSEENKLYNGNDIVVKVLRPNLVEKPSLLASCAAGLVKEGLMLVSLQHNNILSMVAWTPTGLSGLNSGRADAFFLVLSRLQETLTARLKKWATSERKLRFFILGRGGKQRSLLQERLDIVLPLADAVKYLHQNQILHRDLKPDNIGFDSAGVLKLYDFDVARVTPPSSKPDDTFALTSQVGSLRYQSPECAKGEEYNLKTDVYSFALLCHQIITLEKPFDDILSEDHHQAVFCVGTRPVIPLTWPQNLSSLLQCGWSPTISLRPTMEAMYQELKNAIPTLAGEM